MRLLNEFQEGRRFAWDAIRANKMRSALTTVGIVTLALASGVLLLPSGGSPDGTGW